ncbi:MAG: hypothetical protein ABI045_01990 [Flavobacteriales bacterium]
MVHGIVWIINRPFISQIDLKPLGAYFYPTDITKKKFKKNYAMEDKAQSLYTGRDRY